MKIAVIGWGSLIWYPGILDIYPVWECDGPRLPVEYARFSRRDRLTLVLSEGVEAVQTLWTLSRKSTLPNAIDNLRIREGTLKRNIGSWETRSGHPKASFVTNAIEEWATQKRLDAVVWTALGPNRPDSNQGTTTETERLTWLAQLEASGRSGNAREYIEKTPAQIVTGLRIRIRKELGWL
jgi:hypothetical protein